MMLILIAMSTQYSQSVTNAIFDSMSQPAIQAKFSTLVQRCYFSRSIDCSIVIEADQETESLISENCWIDCISNTWAVQALYATSANLISGTIVNTVNSWGNSVVRIIHLDACKHTNISHVLVHVHSAGIFGGFTDSYSENLTFLDFRNLSCDYHGYSHLRFFCESASISHANFIEWYGSTRTIITTARATFQDIFFSKIVGSPLDPEKVVVIGQKRELTIVDCCFDDCVLSTSQVSTLNQVLTTSFNILEIKALYNCKLARGKEQDTPPNDSTAPLKF